MTTRTLTRFFALSLLVFGCDYEGLRIPTDEPPPPVPVAPPAAPVPPPPAPPPVYPAVPPPPAVVPPPPDAPIPPHPAIDLPPQIPYCAGAQASEYWPCEGWDACHRDVDGSICIGPVDGAVYVPDCAICAKVLS
jgi:hypothetical protein